MSDCEFDAGNRVRVVGQPLDHHGTITEVQRVERDGTLVVEAVVITFDDGSTGSYPEQDVCLLT